jgi:WXXGXW repeat (2 copies)
MDFLGRLVDAPFANILIVAGLLFLGIGAVGKVTGKIEPDKFGRLMVSFLGLVLLAAGVATHVRGDKNPNPPPVASVQPVIRSFSVTPAQVTKGGSVTLSWNISDADDVEIEPLGQVSAVGNQVIYPDHNTTYRLSATNKSGGKVDTFQEVIVERKTSKSSRGSSGTTTENNHVTSDGGNDSVKNQNSQDDEQPMYATQPPPPLLDYQQPPDPGGNYRWTPGSWYYDDARSDYYWVPGMWVVPPDGDAWWTPPYWGYEGARYRWHAGYWSTNVGFYGGIAYGFGYFGVGYNQSAKHTHSLSRVSYTGGPHGVRRTPAPLELAANRDRIPALGVQKNLARDMEKNPQQHSNVNHGRPLIVAVAKLQTLDPLQNKPVNARASQQEPVKEQPRGLSQQRPTKELTQGSSQQIPVKKRAQQKAVSQQTQHPPQQKIKASQPPLSQPKPR